jgi:hypothetical protein
LGLDLPPLPLSAALNAASGVWQVIFDRPLAGGALNAANWVIRANDTAYDVDTATAAGVNVNGTSTAGGENEGPDTINYRPPPFDVTSPLGAAAAAFEDFPLVVT